MNWAVFIAPLDPVQSLLNGGLKTSSVQSLAQIASSGEESDKRAWRGIVKVLQLIPTVDYQPDQVFNGLLPSGKEYYTQIVVDDGLLFV